MKKHSLTKILAIMLVLVIVVSYIIEGRSGISHIAIGDVVMNYFQSFYYFFDIVVYILIVGAFYGVLEHIPAYNKIQENIISKVADKKKLIFAIIAIFALLSSLTGLNLILLVFIPFAISLILMMGYDKLVALFSTVGATAVGLIGGIFVSFREPSNYYGTSYATFESFVGLDNNYVNVFPKIVLLIIATVLLILFVNKYINKNNMDEVSTTKETQKEVKAETKKEIVAKVEKKEEHKTDKKEIKKETPKKETNNKKSTSKSTKKPTKKKNLSAAKKDDTIVIKKDKKNRTWPLIVVLVLILILLVLGYMPWNSLFGITIFDDFHTWLTGLAIGDFTVFTNIISANFTAFGEWGSLGSYMMVMIILIIFAIILKFIYKIKFNDLLDYCLEGMKKMLPAVLLSILAYTVLVCVYNNGFMETIITAASDKFGNNIMIHSLITILGSITNVDLYYTAAGIFSPIISALSDSANLQVFAIAFQSFYGLVQIIGPTSLLLIICLAYTDVSYTDWLKNIWRFVLELFIVIFIVILIVSIL